MMVLGVDIDPLVGTGWASFGIVGLVLGWLVTKHIPQLLADSKETARENVRTIHTLIERHDGQLKLAQDSHEARLAEVQETFKLSLDKMLTHCEAETKANAELFRDEVDRLAEVIEGQKRRPPQRS